MLKIFFDRGFIIKTWKYNNFKTFEIEDPHNWNEFDYDDEFESEILNDKKTINDLYIKMMYKLGKINRMTTNYDLNSYRNTLIIEKMISEGSIPETIKKMIKPKDQIKEINKSFKNKDKKTDTQNLYMSYNILHFYMISYRNIFINSGREISQSVKLGKMDIDNIISKIILIENINMIFDLTKKIYYLFCFLDYKSGEIEKKVDASIFNKKALEWEQHYYNFFNLNYTTELSNIINDFDLMRNSIQHRDVVYVKDKAQTQFIPSIKWNKELLEQLTISKPETVEKIIQTSDRYIYIYNSLSKEEFIYKLLDEQGNNDDIIFDSIPFDIFTLSIKGLEYINLFLDQFIIMLNINDQKYLQLNVDYK